jgi:hypothetical protein
MKEGKNTKLGRQARLAAALRENLKRRKMQARGRSAGKGAEKPDEPHDSAGFAAQKRGSEPG